FARFASEKLTDTRVLVVAQRDFAPLSFCDRQVRYSSFWLCLKSNGGNGACRSPLARSTVFIHGERCTREVYHCIVVSHASSDDGRVVPREIPDEVATELIGRRLDDPSPVDARHARDELLQLR